MNLKLERPDSDFADHPGNPYHDDYLDANHKCEFKNCGIPNAKTRRVIKETDQGKGLMVRKDADNLFEQLGICIDKKGEIDERK